MNTNTILVSIITINKNNSVGLQKTINSIQLQKNILFEWIFIDGLSSDLSCINAYNAPFQNKVIISEEDNGIYEAMNKGISRVSKNSVLTVFLNSGDFFHKSDSLKNVIYKFMSSLKKPDIILCASKEVCRYGLRDRIPKNINYIYFGMPSHHQSIIYSSETLKKFNFSLNYKFASDYEQLCRLFLDEKLFLVYYNVLSIFSNDGVSLSKAKESRLEAMEIRSKILKVPYFINLLIYLIHSITHSLKLSIRYF